MTSEILVTLYWIRSGVTGRLVARRRMTGPRLDEFWVSGEVSELRVAAVDPGAQRTTGWRRLLTGLALSELTVLAGDEPIALHLRGADGLRSLRAQAGPDVPTSVLVQVSTWSDQVGGVEVVRGGHLRSSGRPLAGLPLLPVLGRTLRELGMAAGPSAGRPPAEVADAAAEPALWQDLDTAIVHLENVRGAQIGDHNVQVNRFFVQGPAQQVEFERVLLDTGVRDAHLALLAEPTDATRRADLVAALQGLATGWEITAEPLVMSAATKPPGFLERLLTYSVQGLQVGDRNTQRNSFECFVTDVPAVDRLLSEDSALATTLADYLCPADGGTGDLGAFSSRLESSVRNLPVELTSAHGVQLSTPPRGTTVFLRGIDGLSVGSHNRVSERVENGARLTPRLPTGLPTGLVAPTVGVEAPLSPEVSRAQRARSVAVAPPPSAPARAPNTVRR